MKNQKGFTLVEILAMLVILGLLMAVAIPNISGILTNNRMNVYRSDATKMVDTAKMKVAKGSVKKPAKDKCVIMTLSYLNDSEDITKGPNGQDYYQYDSFVILKRENNKYVYYARIVEQARGGDYGINLDTVDNINKEGSTSIGDITSLIGLTGTETNDAMAARSVTDKCPAGSIVGYYK